jgi:S-adenosylmethionine decarboxylase
MYNYSSWIDETNPLIIYNTFISLLNKSGFGVENVIEKHFKPFGYTALFLLSESHFAIHTFPEENKTYIELSSCVKEPFDKFIKSI